MSSQPPQKRRRAIFRVKNKPYTQNEVDSRLTAPPMDKVYEDPQTGEEFSTTEDVPYDKRGFKYTACRPNPYFHSTVYSTSDLPPYGVRFSYTDRSQDLLVNSSLNKAMVVRGWRSCRTNVGIREGKWYIEYKILKANDGESNVRFGIGRKECSVEAPVGYDGYSYGFRDKHGEKVHLSKPTEFLPDGEEFKTGDVVGLLVELPGMDVQTEIAKKQIERRTTEEIEEDIQSNNDFPPLDELNFTQVGVIRDAIPIKYKTSSFFEQYEYTSSKHMDHLLYPVTVFGEKAVRDKKKFKPARLPGSRITLYKNGENKGVAFEDLFAFLPPCSEQQQLNINMKRKEDKFSVGRDDGSLGYYPMVSCYDKGAIEINTGKELAFLPDDLKAEIDNGHVKLLPSRYREQVVEGYVYDLIDETTFAYLDMVDEEYRMSKFPIKSGV